MEVYDNMHLWIHYTIKKKQQTKSNKTTKQNRKLCYVLENILVPWFTCVPEVSLQINEKLLTIKH